MRQSVRRAVRKRAADRCEYCHLPQSAVVKTFHIEHFVAKQHRGGDDPANLALACPFCNLTKGPNLSSIDPDTGEIVTLFSPRQQPWTDHFEMRGAEIIGRTACGRATVALLRMNDEPLLQLRTVLIAIGEW